MDIEGFKKLVKKYEPLHSAFVSEAMTGERYYRNGSDKPVEIPRYPVVCIAQGITFNVFLPMSLQYRRFLT